MKKILLLFIVFLFPFSVSANQDTCTTEEIKLPSIKLSDNPWITSIKYSDDLKDFHYLVVPDQMYSESYFIKNGKIIENRDNKLSKRVNDGKDLLYHEGDKIFLSGKMVAQSQYPILDYYYHELSGTVYYKISTDEGVRLVIGDYQSPAYKSIVNIVLSDNGKDHAFFGQKYSSYYDNTSWIIVRNGVEIYEGDPWDRLLPIVEMSNFHPDKLRTYMFFRKDSDQIVVRTNRGAMIIDDNGLTEYLGAKSGDVYRTFSGDKEILLGGDAAYVNGEKTINIMRTSNFNLLGKDGYSYQGKDAMDIGANDYLIINGVSHNLGHIHYHIPAKVSQDGQNFFYVDTIYKQLHDNKGNTYKGFSEVTDFVLLENGDVVYAGMDKKNKYSIIRAKAGASSLLNYFYNKISNQYDYIGEIHSFGNSYAYSVSKNGESYVIKHMCESDDITFDTQADTEDEKDIAINNPVKKLTLRELNQLVVKQFKIRKEFSLYGNKKIDTFISESDKIIARLNAKQLEKLILLTENKKKKYESVSNFNLFFDYILISSKIELNKK